MYCELEYSILGFLFIGFMGYISSVIMRVYMPKIKNKSSRAYKNITGSSRGSVDEVTGYITYPVWIGFFKYIIFHDKGSLVPLFIKILFVVIVLLGSFLIGYIFFYCA